MSEKTETKKDKETKEPLKIKKPSFKRENDQVFKVKLKEKEDAVSEQKTEKPVLSNNEKKKEEGKENPVGLQEVGSVQEEIKKPIIEEIKEVEKPKLKIEETKKPEMPENIQKLVSFMKETGGNINDYARLNADYSKVDDNTLLKEFYKKSKPHLDQEEIEFVMEDNFYYDEDVDEDRDIRKKKLAKKEEIAKAKNFLEDLKSKYYDEIKLRPGVTQKQQEALDFYNKHNQEKEIAEKRHEKFRNGTSTLFNTEFEGFEFNVGEKRFKYNVNNAEDVREKQSSLSTFMNKFVNKQGEIEDFQGYHKAMYTARNADAIANHFYEQGKADAVKDVMAKSKNLTQNPRATASGDVFVDGLKVKAVSGVDSSRLKIKTKNKN